MGEQAGAELDRPTPAEFATLQRLNVAYRGRSGSVSLAVKGATTHDVLAALGAAGSRRATSTEALRQVARIARFRLKPVVVAPGKLAA